MPDRNSALKMLMLASAVVVGVGILVFLYLYNPQDISGFPKCPFFALTGYKCPGCGTLRGIHSLLHLRFADAWHYNPLMVVSIPFLVVLLCSRRVATSPGVAKGVLIVVVAYWILRNIWERFI